MLGQRSVFTHLLTNTATQLPPNRLGHAHPDNIAIDLTLQRTHAHQGDEHKERPKM